MIRVGHPGWAQDFLHDVDAARSNKVPADDLWGFSLDDDNSSGSDEPNAAEFEMPGFTIPEPGSNDFAPYASKTVGDPPSASEENS